MASEVHTQRVSEPRGARYGSMQWVPWEKGEQFQAVGGFLGGFFLDFFFSRSLY